MANGALELLRDRDRWSAMSKLAMSDSRERFSRDAIVAQYEELYKKAAIAFRK
jgi:glycosyltransferase involved in cell wall biosynthesis